jgi:hypothetical protein
MTEAIRIVQIAKTSDWSLLLRTGESHNNSAKPPTTTAASTLIDRRAVRGDSGRCPHVVQYHLRKIPSGSTGIQNTCATSRVLTQTAVRGASHRMQKSLRNAARLALR